MNRYPLVALVSFVVIFMMSSSAFCIPPDYDPDAPYTPLTWGDQLSMNHSVEDVELMIPYFFPQGFPEDPYDIIITSWLRVNNDWGDPASFAGQHFVIDQETDLNVTHYYGYGYRNFNQRYDNSALYVQSIYGGTAFLEWTSTPNGQCDGHAGITAEEDN